MSVATIPAGIRLERLTKTQSRKAFESGQAQVDDWLKTKALQHQDKHLSVTKVMIDESSSIVGYYTLATGQVDFGDLPADISRKLPHRMLPVAILAWLGVSADRQGQGLGKLLLANALSDAYHAGQTFAFVALIVDCIDDKAKQFYLQYDFQELPGYSNRLYLSAAQLEAIVIGAD